MRIYTRAGDLAFQVFTFPDGQPHFKLETYEREFESVTIETAIKSPCDLFTVLMVGSVLRQHGYSQVNLDIRYLMAARMDRAIDVLQPFTLQVVARLLNGGGFTQVRILDAHSEVATRLIRNSKSLFPLQAALQAVNVCASDCIIVPDHGAAYRAQQVWFASKNQTIIYCDKTRDPNTGALSGFKVNDYQPSIDGTDVIIIDDICDGGGTFVGLAKELRKAGAKKVFLFVTHGIFSKGLPLEGIDHVYTTDSYCLGETRLNGASNFRMYATVIPISMEKL